MQRWVARTCPYPVSCKPRVIAQQSLDQKPDDLFRRVPDRLNWYDLLWHVKGDLRRATVVAAQSLELRLLRNDRRRNVFLQECSDSISLVDYVL